MRGTVVEDSLDCKALAPVGITLALDNTNRHRTGVTVSDEGGAGRPETRPFPFLKLPAELRNEIYGYYLQPEGEEKSTIVSFTKRGCCSPARYHGVNRLALSRISRQVHQEAISYLFRSFEFSFPQLFVMGHSLRRIGDGKTHLTKITVGRYKIWRGTHAADLQTLRDCKSLRHLQFENGLCKVGDVATVAPWHLEGARELKGHEIERFIEQELGVPQK
ncbi:hypothetical protein H2201_000824 [Coniosporium apollinis]|uniref:F-box domain-containing protein n=2 Tax=Coniosporium TaxID=2810619 RepID=A0ABQ9P3Z5_9PEZI|nr:hypothetical protein H2199_001344 [Cladosporium sp. JES 115]KAJ9668998.1 hypothetical protein H2201_000824 [Coniosporium apollinis]